MQAAGFVARCPYELGDKIKIMLQGSVGVTGGPVTEKSAEVTITDILTVHSIKNNNVSFQYEINNAKVIYLISWEDLIHGI